MMLYLCNPCWGVQCLLIRNNCLSRWFLRRTAGFQWLVREQLGHSDHLFPLVVGRRANVALCFFGEKLF